MAVAEKKHHHQLIKQDVIKGFMEKGSRGLRNEAASLWHRVYDKNGVNSNF